MQPGCSAEKKADTQIVLAKFNEDYRLYHKANCEFKVAKLTEESIFFPTKYNFSCNNIGN